MKKFIKQIFFILTIMLLATISGCGKKKDGQEQETLSQKYCQSFLHSKTTDTHKMAEELVALGAFESQLATMDIQEGFLNGFNNEIKGFKNGTMFSPMIGSIPFVGYVFETDNPEALITTLKSSANLNWNICTTADEMVCETRGNLVLFMMIPNN